MTPTTDEEVRSDYLSRVFGCKEGNNVNQLFFAHYNDNMHWRLTVISPWNGLVCWLDPAGEENEINEFAKKIINEYELEGLKKFNMVHRKDIKKIKKNPYIEWKQPKCPRQPQYSKVCGYYVCRYMLEIIQKRVLWVSDKFFQADPCTYSTENIDEIRDLWAKYVLELEQDDINEGNEDGMDIA
uniref:Ubiquitin-like protease family profile domain-containing protein n=1 Tax=Chenopodium quinoa TaxID=63459 RepID=A0A803MX08_CHEQI